MTIEKTFPINDVPVNLIDPPVFNSRIGFEQGKPEGEEDVSELAESMKANGLEQPIKVSGPNAEGRYALIWGSRRYRAARLLKWETIKSQVAPPMTEVDAIIANGVENLQRKNLSSFEQARMFGKLRDAGLDPATVAKRMGVSKQTVNNYVRAYTLLPPSVRGEWQNGNKAASMEFLIELVGPKYKGDTDAETEKLRIAAWEDRKALQEQADSIFMAQETTSEDEDDNDEDDTGNGKPKKKKPSDYKITRDFYKFLQSQLSDKSKRGSITGAGLASKVLELAVGNIDGVRGLTSRNEYEKAKELKASNKA